MSFRIVNAVLPCSKKLRVIVMGLLGFLFYGAWAFLANYNHGISLGVKAALTQGSYSFVITLTLSLLMENIYSLSVNSRFRFMITFLLTCCVLYVTSWGINFLMRTPEILLTILPGLALGTLYALFYILSLNKLNRAAI